MEIIEQIETMLKELSIKFTELNEILETKTLQEAGEFTKIEIKTKHFVIRKSDYYFFLPEYNESLDLTFTEFTIMYYLALNKGIACKPIDIYKFLYNLSQDKAFETFYRSLIPTHICRIRRKLKRIAGENNMIIGKVCKGYIVE